MKVEELYSQNKDSQVGVTFQRQPFETQVDIFPEVSPLQETRKMASQEAGEPVESTLTSVQMEEAVCRVVKHRGEEEFQPIPLKRVDSGPNSHRIQGTQSGSETGGILGERSRHEALLDEIDNAGADLAMGEVKPKKEKKEGTLSRMKERLKNMRGEKGEKDEEGKVTKSISKIFHRVNPVSKASRESFSKVFHRIGDALQRKEEDNEESKSDKTLSLDRKNSDAVDKVIRHKDNEP